MYFNECLCVNLCLFPYGPRDGPNFTDSEHGLPQTALSSTTGATCTSNQLAMDSEIPMDSHRFDNPLERLTELKKKKQNPL